MKTFLLSTFLVVFLGCKKNESSEANSNLPRLKDFERKKIADGWKLYFDEKVKVFLPSDWIPKKKDDMLLLVPIDKRLNLYYAVMEYDVSKVISTKGYLKEIFKQISKDTKDFHYSLRKISFTNNEVCYILEFYTTENKHRYKTYNVIYPKLNKIYDFGFRTINDDYTNPTNQETFYSVLVTLEHNNQNVIDSEKFIVENAEEITYEDL